MPETPTLEAMRHGVGDEASISCGFHWVDNGQVWLELTCRMEQHSTDVTPAHWSDKCRNKPTNHAERSQAAGINPPKKTLTFLCKEREDAAWSGQLFVAGRQEQSKLEEKEKRALPRTSHISDLQTRSTAEELGSIGRRTVSRHGQPLQRSALTRGNAEPGGPADP